MLGSTVQISRKVSQVHTAKNIHNYVVLIPIWRKPQSERTGTNDVEEYFALLQYLPLEN